MKRLIKLIALILVLAALIVAYAVFSNSQKEQPAGDDSAVDTTVEMLRLDKSSIEHIEYTHDGQTVVLKKNDGVWQDANDAELPLDQSYPETMTNGLAFMYATRVIAETLEKEADYGLDTPSLVVKFQTSGGNSYDYSIGDYNGIVNGYYAKISGQNKIYLVAQNVADPFQYKTLDMIKYDKLPSFEADSIVVASYKTGEKAGFVTTNPDGAEFYAEPYAYFTKDANGNVIAVGGIPGAEYMGAISDLKFGGVECYKPDETKLDEYGLSEAKRLALEVTYKKAVTSEGEGDGTATVQTEESFAVNIGKKTDDLGNTHYFASLEGSNVVHKLENGEELYKSIEADFESKLVCPIYEEYAVSFKSEIKGDGSVYFYTVSDLENNKTLKGIFNKITALTFASKDESAEKTELVFTTVFDTGEKELTLNAYKYNDEFYAVSFDTFDNLLVEKTQIDGIIKDLKDYK